VRRAATPAALLPPDDVRVGLAFRRLKILDLSERADQPMGTADGSAFLLFNGEIFNFQDLRRELLSRGRVFRSTGDSEVVLAAYEAWGDACFERLEGMWAIVLADLRRRRIVASRDRFGIKPLYWASDAERFYLASEVRQILAGRGGRPAAHAPLVAGHLRARRLPCLDETFFAGIRAVPPATWFEVPLDAPPPAPTFRRYWDLEAAGSREPPPAYPAAVERLHVLLRDAVRSHDVADVRVGSLLSGGLDSSIVTALHARLDSAAPRLRPTFSFGFRSAAPEACEMPFVDALVRQEGLANRETTFDAEWLWRNFDRVVGAIEEPPLALAPFAQHRVFEACRDGGAVVVLDGQGADEVFAGYPYYQRELLADRAARGRPFALVRETAAILATQGASLFDLVSEGLLRPALRRLRAERAAFLDEGYGAREDEGEIRHALRDRGRDPSRVNRRLFFDVRWGNVKIVLPYSDKNAMAHSVEARLPYFDRRVVEFAFSLPDDYKVGSGQRKRVLRDVGRRLLPPAITERRDRMGFGVPAAAMLRTLWPRVKARLLEDSLLDAPCFVRPGVEGLFRAFESGTPGTVEPVFRILTLAAWRDRFGASLG
jgi:asparagine synthase (glutamine-hydrolysing)